MKKTIIWILLLCLTVAGIAFWFAMGKTSERIVDVGSMPELVTSKRQNPAPAAIQAKVPAAFEGEPVSTADSMTDEEKQEETENQLVDTFDNLTDKWMEPAANGVPMAEVDIFVKAFKQLPKSRQDECIHRALNLIPDGNVMLLVGVLMDKSVDKEIVEMVFNDILNRDEGIKKPILQQIFKDKAHPCWADTAWILDVTGEKP